VYWDKSVAWATVSTGAGAVLLRHLSQTAWTPDSGWDNNTLGYITPTLLTDGAQAASSV